MYKTQRTLRPAKFQSQIYIQIGSNLQPYRKFTVQMSKLKKKKIASPLLTLFFHPHLEALQFLFPFLPLECLSSTYLRLFIFFLAILIPACDSSSMAFHMMSSTYKLYKQGDNIQSCIPFPNWKQSVVPCLVLTVGS